MRSLTTTTALFAFLVVTMHCSGVHRFASAESGIVTNCASSTSHQQQKYQTGECFTLNSDMGSYYNVSKRKVTCDPDPATCGHLVFFKENERTCASENYSNSFAVVCGQCEHFSRTNDTTGVRTETYRKIKCNATTDEIWIDEDCNSDCSVCQTIHNRPHPYLNCSGSASNSRRASYSVYNQGLFPCDTVTEEVFPAGDLFCNGSAGNKYKYKVPQFSCNWGLKWQCDKPVGLPAPKTDKINIQTCKGPKGCSDCTSSTMWSGGCYDGHRYTCQSELATCAHMVFHNSSDTCNNFQSFYNVPCGSCNKWSYRRATWTKTVCDLSTGDVTYVGQCNSDCSVCNETNVRPRPQFQCEPAGWGNLSVYNRGLFPCYTATKETGFSLPNQCGGNATSKIEEVQGVCEYNSVYQCQLDVTWNEPMKKRGYKKEEKKEADHSMVGVVIGLILTVLVLIAGVAFCWTKRKVIMGHKAERDITELEEKLYDDE